MVIIRCVSQEIHIFLKKIACSYISNNILIPAYQYWHPSSKKKKSCYRLQYCLWFLLLTTNCSIFDIKTNQTVETLIFSMANIKDSRNQLYVDSKILLRPIFTCMLIITYYRELWIVSSPPKKLLIHHWHAVD